MRPRIRMHLRSSLLAACLLAHSISMASADNRQSRLAQKDLAPEAAVRTLVVMATAYGERQFAQCVHAQYFGSPLHLRQTLRAAWDRTDPSAEEALLNALRETCSKKWPKIAPSEVETWLRAGNAAVLLEPDIASAIAASAEMVTAYANERGNDLLAQCATDQHANGQVTRALEQQNPKLPASLAVYDAYRKLCGLNRQGPAAADLALPPVPDIATVARERLMIVQDFRICESQGDENACVLHAYKTRSKHIYNRLLSRND